MEREGREEEGREGKERRREGGEGREEEKERRRERGKKGGKEGKKSIQAGHVKDEIGKKNQLHSSLFPFHCVPRSVLLSIVCLFVCLFN